MIYAKLETVAGTHESGFVSMDISKKEPGYEDKIVVLSLLMKDADTGVVKVVRLRLGVLVLENP